MLSPRWLWLWALLGSLSAVHGQPATPTPSPELQSVCDQPLAVGPCKFNITRYHYHKDTNSCYKFIYSGCEGNGNRFVSEKQCRQRCQIKPKKPDYSEVLNGRSFLFRSKANQSISELVKSGGPPVNLTCETCHTINGTCVDGKCQCRMGYKLVNYRCVDIDECEWTKCDANAECINSPGSFRCECRLGFAGSGLNCTASRDVCGQKFDVRYEENCNNTEPTWQQRFFYNISSGSCQQFRYGGCQSMNALNVFRDLQACQTLCHAFRPTQQQELPEYVSPTKTTGARTIPDLCMDKFDEQKRNPCTEGLWRPRYYFDQTYRRCRMFWYDESCDRNPRASNSRNIFVNLRTCLEVCEMIAGNLVESRNRAVEGLIQAVINQQWSAAREWQKEAGLMATTSPATTATTTTATTSTTAELTTTIGSTLAPIINNGLPIADENSFFIDHQHMSDFQRQSLLAAKTKSGMTLDLTYNYSVTAQMPVSVSEECLDPFDSNLARSCQETPKWEERFYFDPDSKACRMFWYGGCMSRSRNNFPELDVCKWKCEGSHHQSSPRDCFDVFDKHYQDDCRSGMYELRYHYNHHTKKCDAFYFGGCRSSSRNFFVDRGECESLCETVPRDIAAYCLQPFDPIYKDSCSADGMFTQYYYFDQVTDSCKMFWYGNCKSTSQNIFATLESCQWLCERKSEAKVPRHCMDKFDENYRRACNGGKWQERYYFDHLNGQCRPFWYDGCISESQNIFNNRNLCKSLCEAPTTTTTTANPSTTTTTTSIATLEDDSNKCLEPYAPGKCKERLPAYFYNVQNRRCEPFAYTGCHGNGNRFLTLSQCEGTCGRYRHLDEHEVTCFLPLSIGFGRRRKSCIRNAGFYFYFDAKEARCGRFWYLGCGGNTNRYRSAAECERICRRSAEKPLQVAMDIPVSACFEAVNKGRCPNMEEQQKLVRWGSVNGKCEAFDYGGCGGNRNRFPTKHACDSLCKGLRAPNSKRCAYFPDWGPCNRLRYMWFYNLTKGTCEQFLYGGCGGNENRFSTFEECQITCEVPGEDPCGDKLDRGKWCESMSNRYYYHAKSKTCKGFHYTGCGQSRNNFINLDDCKDVCIYRRKTHSGSTSGHVFDASKKSSSVSTGMKYSGKKPPTYEPMTEYTVLNESGRHYLKSDGQWVEYGHCIGFRYNISGPFTRLNSYICLMEKGGTCVSEAYTNTFGEEQCRVIRPWLRGSHFYSWFFTIERGKMPNFPPGKERPRRFMRPQKKQDTLASLIILPINDCYNIC